MPSETDVAPKAICGWVGLSRGNLWAGLTFGAKNAILDGCSTVVLKVDGLDWVWK